jgi:hypothetical protein
MAHDSKYNVSWTRQSRDDQLYWQSRVVHDTLYLESWATLGVMDTTGVLSSYRLIGRLRTTLYGSVSATKPGLVPLSPRGILPRLEEQSRPHRRENRRPAC